MRFLSELSLDSHREDEMFPKYRHTPIFDPDRKRCEVCHRAVYSLAGIHPQCAIKRAVALESLSKKAASKSYSVEAIEAGREQVILTEDGWQPQAETGLCN
jgi:hypothetical protein